MSLFKLQIKTKNQTYPIIIGDGSANRLKKIFKENAINFNQCLVVIDQNVPKKL